MKNNKYKNKYQKGAAMMIIVLFFMFISVTIIVGIVTPVAREFQIVSSNLNSKRSYFLAESGNEDALYRIKNNLDIDSSETLVLGNSSVVTTITDIGMNEKEISTIGDTNSHQRKINTKLLTSSGTTFNYGVYAGQGGIELLGSSHITGDVYANGPIKGTGSCWVTGSAISANSPPLSSNQSNGFGTPPYNINFGNNNATQDIAQSFILNDSNPLNKIQFYLKKVGSPSNATVKIVNDLNGSPGSTVYASGTLTAGAVSTSYNWVEVYFSTNPLLDEGVNYWVVIDASTSSSKYYTIGANTTSSYINGVGKIGRLGTSWGNTTPANVDFYFNLFLGGINGLIHGTGSEWWRFQVGTSGNGSAQAHTVNNTAATGLIYCQEGVGNNKACSVQNDPTYQEYPISDDTINQWKDDASSGGVINGNYTTPSYDTSTLGPKKIVGNLNVGGSHTLKLTGTVWVTGNVTVDGSAKIILDSSYGGSSGLLIADGWLNLAGSGQLNGNGQTGSYLTFLTTSNCDSSFCSHNAIDISGAAGSVVLYAQNGSIYFSGSSSAKAVVGYKIKLDGATGINFESMLNNVSFTTGSSGSWVINSWRETE